MGWGAADGVWTLPVGHFYSFFSQFVTANVDTVEGSPVSFGRLLWRPLLVCCGMIATLQDLVIPTKCRPLLLSGKRRGTEHYSLPER